MNVVNLDYTKSLYKKDTKGNIRILTISVIGNKVEQSSGILNGAMVPHIYEAKAKNIGRSNETTPEEQAVLEAKSIVDKKLKKDYFESEQEAKNNKVILPMLAKDFKKEKKKVEYPCYSQPKFDGMRALLVNGKFYSRQGVLIDTLPPYMNSLKFDFILDGELYAHGMTFQENMELIKKYRPGESERIKFHIYDVVKDLPYSERMNIISKFKGATGIEVVKTTVLNSEKELKGHHRQYLDLGYEGTMIRWGNDGYKVNARSSNLLKYKDFIDETYVVTDVVPSDKDPEKGVVVCGKFRCGMKFSHNERKEILKNKEKYIGKKAEVRFFEYTDDGLPRFPVCVGFRLDR